jgi:hypothetical protein
MASHRPFPLNYPIQSQAFLLSRVEESQELEYLSNDLANNKNTLQSTSLLVVGSHFPTGSNNMSTRKTPRRSRTYSLKIKGFLQPSSLLLSKSRICRAQLMLLKSMAQHRLFNLLALCMDRHCLFLTNLACSSHSAL